MRLVGLMVCSRLEAGGQRGQREAERGGGGKRGKGGWKEGVRERRVERGAGVKEGKGGGKRG